MSLILDIAEVINSSAFKVLRRLSEPYLPRQTRALLKVIFDKPLDQRLKKIDEARTNLAEALSAIEELQREAQLNQHTLEQLTVQLDEAGHQKTVLESELETVRDLASRDAIGLRKALGIPTRGQIWLERLLSFAIGVCASLLASYLWRFTPWA